MGEFTKYLVLGFSALLPLMNPPGTAIEFLGILGLGESKPYKLLARKVAIDTTIFLTLVMIAGPYILQFFGISIEILQLVGGTVLAAMGWQLLNKPEANALQSADAAKVTPEETITYWQAKAFYPLTFPITVGPGSVAVTLTLSAQAKSLVLEQRVPALLGLFACIIVLSAMIYAFCASAPLAVKRFPGPVVHGILRIVAFLVICIGAQIAWHGLHALLISAKP